VSARRAAALADRKALLAARASLDRARLSVAVHDIRTIVAPPRVGSLFGGARPVAAMIVGIAAPLIGPGRLRRVMRYATLALMVYRIVRNWRSAPR
jgi:hypothetical protein